MNKILRRSIFLIVGLFVCSTVILFTFHEGAQSALDTAVKNAQERIDRTWSKTECPPERVADVADRLGGENATFFTLCQNKDLTTMLRAVHSVENKFNKKFKYDWVFLNDEDFSGDFKKKISEVVSGEAKFGKLDKEAWGYPEWIDLDRAADTRKWMRENNVVYGDLESYHHMCRFQAGYFFRHPLMLQYKYAWRVEPSISILCDQKVDPFWLMRVNDYYYGFNIAPLEIKETIPSLWNTTKTYLSEHEHAVDDHSLKEFVSDDDLETYNSCHFWTNFEITNLDWLRSPQYLDFFNFLDKEGGFYYERWGDAPVRSIAASLFLPKNKIYFFNEIGYYHAPYGHCPFNQGPLELDCDCKPRDYEISLKYYDYHGESCMRRYWRAKGRRFYDPGT